MLLMKSSVVMIPSLSESAFMKTFWMSTNDWKSSFRLTIWFLISASSAQLSQNLAFKSGNLSDVTFLSQFIFFEIFFGTSLFFSAPALISQSIMLQLPVSLCGLGGNPLLSFSDVLGSFFRLVLSIILAPVISVINCLSSLSLILSFPMLYLSNWLLSNGTDSV